MNAFVCDCGFNFCFQGSPDNLGPEEFVPYCSNQCMDTHMRQHKEWERVNFGGKPKWCHSCEERTNVTNHICKAQERSTDYIDFFIQLFGPGRK